MINLLQNNLIQAGYRVINLNRQDSKIFFHEFQGVCYAVNVVDYRDVSKSTMNTSLLVSINSSVTNFLRQQGMNQIKMITIICTYNADLAAELTGGMVSYWVLDSYHSVFVVPRWQPEDFANVDEIVKATVDQRSYTGSVPSKNYRKKKSKVFTLNNLMVLINVIAFILLEMSGSTEDARYMVDNGAYYWPRVKFYGEYYRFFTCMFLHFGFSHLFNNMLVLFFIGDNLERAVGKLRYLIIYIGSGLVASVVSCCYYLIIGQVTVSAGASGAIFGVIGALTYIVAVNKGKLEDLNSFGLAFFVIISLYMGITSTGVDNAAHVGGFIAGLVFSKFLYKKKPMKYNVDSRI